MEEKKIIIINGNEFLFEADETILDVARRNDIDIPTLCHLKGTIPHGACRICVVEVEGADELMTACETPASGNMIVKTESPCVVEARRSIIQLMLSSGNHNCAISGYSGESWESFQLQVQKEDDAGELCPVWGDCRLQDLAYRYQVVGSQELVIQSLYPLSLIHI